MTKQDESLISPAMVKAGVYALREMPLLCDWEELVQEVFLAMYHESASERAAAVSTNLRK